MAAAVAGATAGPVSGASAGSELRLGTSEELEAAAAAGGNLDLGALDLTTEQLSLAGIEKELEAFGDSEVLRAILDQGGCCQRGAGCARHWQGRGQGTGRGRPSNSTATR